MSEIQGSQPCFAFAARTCFGLDREYLCCATHRDRREALPTPCRRCNYILCDAVVDAAAAAAATSAAADPAATAAAAAAAAAAAVAAVVERGSLGYAN